MSEDAAAETGSTAASENPEAGAASDNPPPRKKPEILIIILCIFLPPVGVYMYFNECNSKVCIAAVLWFFGIPGLIYALCVVGCCDKDPPPPPPPQSPESPDAAQN